MAQFASRRKRYVSRKSQLWKLDESKSVVCPLSAAHPMQLRVLLSRQRKVTRPRPLQPNRSVASYANLIKLLLSTSPNFHTLTSLVTHVPKVPSGNCMYRLLYHSVTLHFAHRVSHDCHNEQISLNGTNQLIFAMDTLLL
jgi:hypothetical protein